MGGDIEVTSSLREKETFYPCIITKKRMEVGYEKIIVVGWLDKYFGDWVGVVADIPSSGADGMEDGLRGCFGRYPVGFG
jgi:hypothetical protein